jgi:hypothetical protein
MNTFKLMHVCREKENANATCYIISKADTPLDKFEIAREKMNFVQLAKRSYRLIIP